MSKVKVVGEKTIDKGILEEKIVDLIKERLVMIKKELLEINNELSFFTKKYSLDEEEFLDKFNKGTLGDDEDYFVWEGSINIKRKLLEEQKMLSELI